MIYLYISMIDLYISIRPDEFYLDTELSKMCVS